MRDPPRGIKACGAYLPRLRMERAAIVEATGWARARGGKADGERSFCNWDEDAITMAVEAARDCLADLDRQRVGWLGVGSTTLPFADRSGAGVVAGALNLREDIATLDVNASQRAGMTALITAVAHCGGSDGDALVVAADRRLARPGSTEELAYGHGGAALLVGRGDEVVAELLGSASLACDFVDHYRAAERDFDYVLEERWVRDEGHLALLPRVIAAALAQAGVVADRVAHFIAPCPARTTEAVARAAGLPAGAVGDDLRSSCGDIGTAHPLLQLVARLERAAADELVLVTGFGQGCDAIVLRATARIGDRAANRGSSGSLAAGRRTREYLRLLSNCGLVEMDWGMRAERDSRTAQSVAWRKRRDVTAFIGGRCASCGTVQFPRARACVNPECRRFDTQQDHPLAETGGHVKSYTEDWLAYTRSPPLVYGNVALAGGGNVFVEFTDTVPGEIAVGTPVRFVFRIKDFDAARDFRRYFWKAAVARH